MPVDWRPDTPFKRYIGSGQSRQRYLARPAKSKGRVFNDKGSVRKLTINPRPSSQHPERILETQDALLHKLASQEALVKGFARRTEQVEPTTVPSRVDLEQLRAGTIQAVYATWNKGGG